MGAESARNLGESTRPQKLRGGDTCVSVYRVVSLYRCIALYRAVSLYRDIEALSPCEGKYTAV